MIDKSWLFNLLYLRAAFPKAQCPSGRREASSAGDAWTRSFCRRTWWKMGRKLAPLVLFFFFSVDFRGRERERETLISSIYSCTHWLLLACALTGDQTCNLGRIDPWQDIRMLL